MACLDVEEINALNPKTKVLELGCGQIKRWTGSTTVDVNPRSQADVLHDLNVFPYPFAESQFDLVIAEHVLEHLDDITGVVEELHRIIKPGGILKVEVPHYSSCDFFTDPTHKHAFSSRSFDYFVPDNYLADFKYSTAKFKKRSVVLSPYAVISKFRKAICDRLYRDILNYEINWAFIFPSQKINFDLEVIK